MSIFRCFLQFVLQAVATRICRQNIKFLQSWEFINYFLVFDNLMLTATTKFAVKCRPENLLRKRQRQQRKFTWSFNRLVFWWIAKTNMATIANTWPVPFQLVHCRFLSQCTFQNTHVWALMLGNKLPLEGMQNNFP